MRCCLGHGNITEIFAENQTWMRRIMHGHSLLFQSGDRHSNLGLVIVLIVHQDCVLAFKFEREAPVSADVDSPVILEMAGETMKPPSRSTHIFRPLGIVQREQLQAKLVGMLWLNARFRSRFKELFQATVAKAPDHSV